MLKLSTDEKRSLQFEVSIQGIDYKELTGSLRFVVEGIEYGFPVKILQDHIEVEVPPLDDIIFKGMKDGVIADCKLEIFGNGFHLKPWQGQFKFKTPVKMEAKMRYAEDIEPVEPLQEESKPKKIEKKVTAVLKEETVAPQKEEDIDLERDELLEVLFEKFKTPSKTKKKTIKKKQPSAPVVTENKEPEQKSDLVGSLVDSLLTGTRKRIKPIQESKKISKPKKVTKVKNINDPVALMESLGLKNPRVQRIMLERAETMGGSDNESLIRTLQQMLTNQRPLSSFEQFTLKKGMESQIDDE